MPNEISPGTSSLKSINFDGTIHADTLPQLFSGILKENDPSMQASLDPTDLEMAIIGSFRV